MEERKDSTRLPFKIILWLSTTNVAIISSIIDFGVTMSPIGLRIMKNHPVICTYNNIIIAFYRSITFPHAQVSNVQLGHRSVRGDEWLLVKNRPWKPVIL